MSRIAKAIWMILFVALQLADLAVLDPVAAARAAQAGTQPAVQTAAGDGLLSSFSSFSSSRFAGGAGASLKGELHDGCHGLHAMAAPKESMLVAVLRDSALKTRALGRRPGHVILSPPVPPPNS